MVVSIILSAALAQNLPLPPLPYEYASLEPHIDEATMRVHHMSHHQTYTDKLNGALAKLRADPDQKWLAKLGVDALLRKLGDISDEDIRKTVRNAGGGYVNHDVFFHSMSPTGGGTLEGDGLAGELVRTYGSVTRFKQAFTLAALEVFGSGWAWLVYDVREKGLRITATSNQDTPAMQEGMVPLLALDVWEHAYYIKHQSRRVLVHYLGRVTPHTNLFTDLLTGVRTTSRPSGRWSTGWRSPRGSKRLPSRPRASSTNLSYEGRWAFLCAVSGRSTALWLEAARASPVNSFSGI